MNWVHVQYSPLVLLFGSLVWSAVVLTIAMFLRRRHVHHFGVWLALGFASWIVPGLVIYPSLELVSGANLICFGDPGVIHFVSWFLPPLVVVALTPGRRKPAESAAP